ncbi:hypothetical protein T12_3343 [Trichinella patagoniensis]|uniref:Uncharacterized protein n=1 Tax=Trichinella patagoniensis TaxID=990121 RepID=A0A0V1A6P2_9BILA|nr:hypothetical protein T12_3343 [Trichinella patagoniensis]
MQYLIYCCIKCKESTINRIESVNYVNLFYDIFINFVLAFITTDLQGFITGAAAYSDCRKTLCRIYIVDIPFKAFWFLNND